MTVVTCVPDNREISAATRTSVTKKEGSTVTSTMSMADRKAYAEVGWCLSFTPDAIGVGTACSLLVFVAFVVQLTGCFL